MALAFRQTPVDVGIIWIQDQRRLKARQSRLPILAVEIVLAHILIFRRGLVVLWLDFRAFLVALAALRALRVVVRARQQIAHSGKAGTGTRLARFGGGARFLRAAHGIGVFLGKGEPLLGFVAGGRQ